jgi:hypothetical protein
VLLEIVDEHEEKVEITIHIVATVGLNDELEANEIEKTVEHDDIENDTMFFHDEIVFDDEVEVDDEHEDSETVELDELVEVVEEHPHYGLIVEQMVDVEEILDYGDVEEHDEDEELELHQLIDEDDELDDVDIYEVNDENEEQHDIQVLVEVIIADDDTVETEIVE